MKSLEKKFKNAVKENIKNPVLNYNTGDYNFIIRNNIKIITASFNDILSEKEIFEKLVKIIFLYLHIHLMKKNL